MFVFPQNTVNDWTRPATEAFEFWVSFWPVAPVFGVEWRFADAAAQATGFAMPDLQPAKPAPAPAPKPRTAVREAPAAAKPAAQPGAMPAAKSALKPVAKVAARASKPEAVKEAAVPAPKPADDLKLIKGIGPGLEKQLNGLGVYRFEQIAGFSKEDLIKIDDQLTAFKGRCFRDDWIGQAKAQLA